MRRVRHPRYNYRVSFPETLPDGTTIRRASFFVNKGEAESFAKERKVAITNHGTRHSNITDEERAAIIRFREWAASRDDAPSLSSMVERAIAAHADERPPMTVAEAIDARLEAAERRGLSSRHRQDLQCRLERSDLLPQSLDLRLALLRMHVSDDSLALERPPLLALCLTGPTRT